MHVYSYVIPHDYGFAPNPYGGFLTLATCKPKIRKTASKGDFIAGTGSVSTVGNDKLVYAAEIADVVSIADYGHLSKYKVKRPSMRGPDSHRHGDNIYFFKDDSWHQRTNRYHGPDCLDRDVSGVNILACDRFWYFGENAIIKKGLGSKHSNSLRANPPVYLRVRSATTKFTEFTEKPGFWLKTEELDLRNV